MDYVASSYRSIAFVVPYAEIADLAEDPGKSGGVPQSLAQCALECFRGLLGCPWSMVCAGVRIPSPRATRCNSRYAVSEA